VTGGPTVVLVDAENVRRSRWPNVSRARLVELVDAWADANRVRAVVVFDGRDHEGRVGEHTPVGAASVVGTGGESADDWIVRRAAELAAARKPYRLVTSDRAVREAAGPAAAETVGGGSFLRELDADEKPT
jgi:predicted RNA-binding protein with PIN domain